MDPRYILAIDAGTTKLKVILFDENGSAVDSAVTHVDYMQPEADWFEMDMNHLWEKLETLVKELLIHSNIHPASVISIGITGQGEGCWLVDGDFQPVRNAILWLDKRAASDLKNLQDDVLQAYKNISFSSLVPGATIALLKWLDMHEPLALNRAAYCLSCKDWLRYKLTGAIRSDFSDASTSMLDLQTAQISAEVFELIGIQHRQSLVAPLSYGSEVAGLVSKEASFLTGLVEGTPVITGVLDIVANALGCGAIGEGDVSVTIGTTCSSQVILNKLPGNASQVGSVLCGATENQYIHMVGSMAGTPNMDWLARELYGIDLHDKEKATNFFTLVDKEIKAVEVGAKGVVYHPYIMTGERAPFYNPYAVAQFFGIHSKTTKEHLSRAVYEGIAFSIKDCLHLNIEKKRIILSGGASNSEILPQIVADCLGVEVVKLVGKEQTAKGVFMLAAVQSGIVNSLEEAIHKTTHIAASFQPNMENHRRYNELFHLYKNLRKMNARNWELRHRFLQGTNSRLEERV
ncbi:FGGY-family carbohydrate kinase [Sporosarcina sp. G11-34]|uniref:FGGY-family carbohydrate kinase n=1 Tax=Sporosarcina sp. G11-34 TaxID=2849605 RepID=UPI0022A961E4|nr:FGGY-family carbohydrate kinase [Sporosarcina sp. G11-34]MCZ2258100.1 carbohydrate kinase [Sporosarcina sp. G11-34]